MNNIEYNQNLANTYDFLREVFFNKWNTDTLQDVKDKAALLDVKLQESSFVKSVLTLEGSTLDNARWEYNRLFVGPSRPIASPFESVYRSEEGLMMREYAYDVREFYAQVGLIVEQIDQFPDDFIGFEYQYLYYTSELIAKLIKNDKMDEANELIAVRNEFNEKHPKEWFPDFCTDIREHSTETIWKEMADFISNTLEEKI